jgi:hypothetical protein
MKIISLLIFSILFLSYLTGLRITSARTLVPGVARGDVFYYEMYGGFSSSDPNSVILVPPFEANNTDWVRIKITDVAGSIINHVYTLHYKNGTEERIEGLTDVASNSSYSHGFRGVPICPANLNAGDTLPTVQLTVNDTLLRTYPFGERETNHVTWKSSIDYGDCYFDRQTGMLIELYRVHLFINPETNETISKTDVVKMTSSSSWTSSKLPTFSIPSLIIVAAALGSVSYRRKLTKKKQD